MKLSIITINYNNAEGLRKTLASVAAQTYADIEHIIVDGGSSDNSVEVIREYEQSLPSSLSPLASRLKWISEPDKGIYNAMNKGIEIALGRMGVTDDHHSMPLASRLSPDSLSDYIQILNSGDLLYDSDVVQKMLECLGRINSKYEIQVGVLYGNIIKSWPDGRILKEYVPSNMNTTDSFLFFYRGTLNPDGTMFHRSLFEKYGMFNEQMKICSDWEWFVRTVVLGEEKPIHIDVDTVLFDMTGISESGGRNRDIIFNERREYLESILPKSVLSDYDRYSFPITQYQRLKKYHLWGIVSFIERVVFKYEKWYNQLFTC